jgi:RNA polymerase sigma factor (sigma-70 family)
MTKKTVDVETIDILLIGNEEEIAEAVRQINDGFKEKIVEIIRKKALSANEHDLSDIYQNVILSILECAKKGNYDPDVQKLVGFIYKIAYRRAVDWVREKCGIKEQHNTDLVVESTREIICGSKYNEPWQKAQSEEKRSLILETVRNLISKLKRRQRQVAEVILENFPNLLSNLDIKNQILKRYGEDVTALAVKSARKEVCNKVKEALSIAGYGDYIND